MTFALAGTLLVLALVDSTSFGTLLIPIWFLLAPGRVPVGRMLVFLGTVAAFYLGVGVALLFGMGALLDQLNGLTENPVFLRAQLVLGVGLLVWSFFIGKPRKDADGTRAPGRLTRWRERALGQQGTRTGLGGLVTLALAAAMVEVATMLPYLGAIGLLGTSGLSVPEQVGALAVYCLVMVLPALVLLAGRLVAHRLVDPLLQRIARWMEKSGGEMTAWIVGILGFLIARDAVARMPELLDFLDGLG
ncbi:GAP family protein [Ornithinicoccus hortensis]|uniref:Sap-like sulfolipid-1-addressing protein n=1 Tax=Ornithinicoccus hortensis TaxID=82346 RepID=A0A542YNN1_9MICO|nr:GAP family protein [Ornithinicoccus hortensis]TQL49534.1 Sap-like sulfolipid-1-addressing protein [Ornithinicoccus hortensis]